MQAENAECETQLAAAGRGCPACGPDAGGAHTEAPQATSDAKNPACECRAGLLSMWPRCWRRAYGSTSSSGETCSAKAPLRLRRPCRGPCCASSTATLSCLWCAAAALNTCGEAQTAVFPGTCLELPAKRFLLALSAKGQASCPDRCCQGMADVQAACAGAPTRLDVQANGARCARHVAEPHHA